MSPFATIQDAQSRELVSEDGDVVELELRPGLSAQDLARFESKLPCAVPPSVRELLQFCSGFSGPIELVDFTGATLSFELEAIFPAGLPIATDGCGNFWVVDLSPSSSEWAPIYFACHDAPVILFQSPSLEHFLKELFKLSEPPFASLVDDVHEDRLFDVWRANPGVKSYAECIGSGDDDLKTFAEELGPKFRVVDMRKSEIGFGFSWERYGPNTVVRRYGMKPIFAYEQRRRFLSRLFGGSA